MKFVDSVKNHLSKNFPIYLIAWAIYGIPTTAIALVNNWKEQSRLAQTADIVCTGRGYPNLYGFDEDRNGSIDRI